MLMQSTWGLDPRLQAGTEAKARKVHHRQDWNCPAEAQTISNQIHLPSQPRGPQKGKTAWRLSKAKTRKKKKMGSSSDGMWLPASKLM